MFTTKRFYQGLIRFGHQIWVMSLCSDTLAKNFSAASLRDFVHHLDFSHTQQYQCTKGLFRSVRGEQYCKNINLRQLFLGNVRIAIEVFLGRPSNPLPSAPKLILLTFKLCQRPLQRSNLEHVFSDSHVEGG